MVEYLDQDGNPTTLDALCRAEPAWAANRIRAELAEVERLRGLLEGMVEQAESSMDSETETTDAARAALAAEAGEED